MKKINRVFIYILTVLCCSFGSVFALEFNNSSMGSASLITETIKSYELSDGLNKKEVISTICYSYLEDLASSSYKYTTVRIDLTYFSEIDKKVLAVATIESNFRCNSVTKQSECLSTSRGNVLNDPGCVLNIFLRRANCNTEVGGSVAEVKFKNKGKTYEKNVYRISCDYMGNINYA